MKKILMAAAAVTALTAGSAGALTIDKAGTPVNTVSIAPSTNTLGIVTEPYTLASETIVSSATNVSFVAKLTPAAAAGLTQGNSYIVTFTIAGGTFETTGIGTGDIGALGTGNTTTSTGEVTPTKIQYVLQSAATGGTNVAITAITWTSKGIIPGTDKSPVTVTASLANLTSPTQVIDGGAVSATVLDFRQGLTFKASPADKTLSIASGFKKFGNLTDGPTADTTTASIGTSVGFTNTGTANTLTSDKVYKTGATEIDGTVVTSADLTVTGNLSSFDARIGSGSTAQLADVATGVISTLNNTNLGTLQTAGSSITLQPKATPVTGVESGYSVKPTSVVMSTGFLPGTFAAKTIGSVSFDGVNIYAPWVGDGTNGISYSIRLGNRTATAVGNVKATLLNPVATGTSGTVASTVACDVGSIPASGELIVNSDVLKACFGSFKRSDVRLTIQASKDSVTAKMRTASAGVVNEATLGTGTNDKNGATN